MLLIPDNFTLGAGFFENIETVVIVPFESLAVRYEPDTVVCIPISGRVFVTDPGTAGGDRFLITRTALSFIS